MRKWITVCLAAIALILGLHAFTIFVCKIPPKQSTLTAMCETFVRIGISASRNGSIPTSLDVLPKRDGYSNCTTDAWNRPLRYSIAPDGVIILMSFGKDGKPGGEGDNADISSAYQTRKPDGSLWAGASGWIIDGEITKEHAWLRSATKPSSRAEDKGR